MSLDVAWVAGFFDGEGNIWIGKGLLQIQIAITQKEIGILRLIQQQYGGSVCKYGIQSCHKWRVCNTADGKRFLWAIKDHVICKKTEVELALRFLETKRENNKGCHPLSAEQIELRSAIRDKMVYLNNIH